MQPCIRFTTILVDTSETDQQLHPLHKNIRKYGTVSNTVAAATESNGATGRATAEI